MCWINLMQMFVEHQFDSPSKQCAFDFVCIHVIRFHLKLLSNFFWVFDLKTNTLLPKAKPFSEQFFFKCFVKFCVSAAKHERTLINCTKKLRICRKLRLLTLTPTSILVSGEYTLGFMCASILTGNHGKHDKTK